MAELIDLIKMNMEIQERYHTTKERSAWLGSTFYYIFSIGVITSLLSPENYPLDRCQSIGLGILCLTVFTGAMFFIYSQFSWRWTSVTRTQALKQMTKSYTEGAPICSFEDSYNAHEEELKKTRKRCKPQIIIAAILGPLAFIFLFWVMKPKEYRTEIPAYGIAFYLFVAQVAIIVAQLYRT